MYDPTVGRFLSEDPIGIAGGDPNFYRYCENNPLTHTDPTGLCKEDCCCDLGNDVMYVSIVGPWFDPKISGEELPPYWISPEDMFPGEPLPPVPGEPPYFLPEFPGVLPPGDPDIEFPDLFNPDRIYITPDVGPGSPGWNSPSVIPPSLFQKPNELYPGVPNFLEPWLPHPFQTPQPGPPSIVPPEWPGLPSIPGGGWIPLTPILPPGCQGSGGFRPSDPLHPDQDIEWGFKIEIPFQPHRRTEPFNPLDPKTW